ncbi:nucleoside kinase [Fusobacterium sp. PH5-44]|uniref:uridine kinase family protein n=1 Tax=unclassified Fusobacterium TaxID=2648384 RepID=UPI003D1C892A
MTKFDPRKYEKTIKLIFLKAVNDLFPNSKVLIEHSLNNGVYGEIQRKDNEEITEEELLKVTARMREIIEENYPINLVVNDCEKLKLTSHDIKREDVRMLIDNSGLINIYEYEIDSYHDYIYGKPYNSTGDVDLFHLSKYNGGFILKYPIKNIDEIPIEIDNPKMAKVFQETGQWERILGVSTIGYLNEKILKSKAEIGELIRINEALHHKNIAKIAGEITDNREIKLITIAGPSSSGKTTFSKRLYIHLKANEVNPIIISLDNYYIGRNNVPLDEEGNKDFETIEALDLDLLNQNLRDLIAGKEVEIPRYNFVTGNREATGEMMRMPENGLIIIEGIHGLNERLSFEIPKKNKYKIYISCLTQLNIDNHNRIGTSDVRLIRRLTRDSMSRATHVEDTLDMWKSVRRGEEKYIFPFQEEADIIFNSNLVYELGVLKSYASKELIKVKINSPYYKEAKRLLQLLNCFLDIDSRLVPDDSILKEFIGDSIFYRY